MSNRRLVMEGSPVLDVFKDRNFDIENEIHFCAMVLKNTLTEYGLSCDAPTAIAVDDFTNETVLFILGGSEASYERFDKAVTLFLSGTNDNTPRYIMDLAYLCQEIVQRFGDGIEYESEILRVLSENNLYGMPPKEA